VERFGISAVLLLVWFLILFIPAFSNPDNFINVFRQSAFVGIAAVGMTMPSSLARSTFRSVHVGFARGQRWYGSRHGGRSRFWRLCWWRHSRLREWLVGDHRQDSSLCGDAGHVIHRARHHRHYH
jgi:hypothetical protein